MSKEVKPTELQAVGAKFVEILLDKVQRKGEHHEDLNRRDRRLLKKYGPILFTQGVLWSADNISLRIEKKEDVSDHDEYLKGREEEKRGEKSS